MSENNGCNHCGEHKFEQERRRDLSREVNSLSAVVERFNESIDTLKDEFTEYKISMARRMGYITALLAISSFIFLSGFVFTSMIYGRILDELARIEDKVIAPIGKRLSLIEKDYTIHKATKEEELKQLIKTIERNNQLVEKLIEGKPNVQNHSN